MNKVILVGRLTRDPDLRSTASGVSVCSFTVVCDRRYVKQGEERQADFINCVAWRQTGEGIARYFKKGHRIALEGSIQTRSWVDRDGNTRYATEVIVEQWEFAQSKNERAIDNGQLTTENDSAADDLDGFLPVDDLDLPF